MIPLILFLLTLGSHELSKIYLDKNGVTLKCEITAKIGDTLFYEDSPYLIVDNEMLRDLVEKRSSVEHVITTFVTDMSYLFYRNTDFDQDISRWDVSNVTNMTHMFGYAEQFESDLSYWNTSKVEYFSDMFYGTKKFNSDLSQWNVSKGLRFNGMFHNSNFNNPINSWDVSNANDMSGMFDDAIYFNQALFNWNVSRVKNMGGMFAEAVSFNQDISMWNVQNVEIMDNMFRNTLKFSQDLSDWKPNIMGVPRNFLLNNSFILPQFKSQKINYRLIAFVACLSILIFVVIISLLKTQRSRHLIDPDIVKKLKILKERNQPLSRIEIDEILEISDLNIGLQKVKRADLIRQINIGHNNLIQRERDPKDKRTYLYHIRR